MGSTVTATAASRGPCRHAVILTDPGHAQAVFAKGPVEDELVAGGLDQGRGGV